jgi:conjugal transfer pilus assembly protein TraF
MRAGWGEDADSSRYFERGAEGWFWYEPDPAPEGSSTPEVEAPLPPDPAVALSDKIIAPIDQFAEGPAPLSAAWFRANLDDYRDRALDHPSPENVEAYLYLQKIALERAGAFAEASTAATVKDPWLDANSERPIATYAAQAVDAQAEAARSALLQELAKEAGILFFYQADCPLCASQASVLKLAKDVHGFEIVAVSLDGSPPPGGLESHRTDRGQAARLGVAALPATFLIRPPDLIAPLAQAPLDLQTLGRRIIGQAHAAGLVSDEVYLATRAIRRPFALPTDLGDIPADVLEDPTRLVAHIRRQLGMPGTGERP